jgi:Mg2+-importing ATPase
MSDVTTLPPYWSGTEQDLFRNLGSRAEGLTDDAAAAALATCGPNEVAPSARMGPLRMLARQFVTPLVLILVLAATVSLFLREWIDAGIILTIVLASGLLGFSQEFRASAAMNELKQRLALTCRVRRGGAVKAVPARDVVPGDVVLLSAGNLIPADGRILSSQDFLVSEASMTGESFPVEKAPGIAAADAPVAERRNTVFLGASVRSGTAEVLVARTGTTTEFAAIAARIGVRPEETDFSRGVRRFGAMLMRVMVVIVLLVLTVDVLNGRSATDSLLFAAALAVGLSPELLPAIISITLSAGARAMSREGVIVRRLDAIENLGSMDVLCTDKTGTLTEGKIVLTGALDPGGAASEAVGRLAFVNASLQGGMDNPLDAALVAAGQRAGWTIDGSPKVAEIPYDFSRRRLTIVTSVNARPDRHLMISKGAFDNVLEVSTHVAGPAGPVPLDPDMRQSLAARFAGWGQEGFRVIAVATRQVPAAPSHGRAEEADMTFEGFLLFVDPPRADAADTIAAMKALGISVKIVSGDNRHVSAHLAGIVGLDGKAMLTGAEIQAMTDEAMWKRASETDLFVEVDPQQKQRIIRALRHAGHAVGYMGDGINDVPALLAADVGLSVEGAADVARESADIVLLRPDLSVLRRGVEDGRRTFANTLKYIGITVSANFGNMISMAIAAPFLPYLPLAAKQILLNNFLSDLPSAMISTDNVDSDRVDSPQRWDVGYIQRFMIVFGLISSVFDMITFAVLLKFFQADEATFQTGWFIVSLLTELAVVLVLRTSKPALRSQPSRLLLWSTIAAAAATPFIPLLPWVGPAFGFVRLPPAILAALGAIVLGYIVATETAKLLLARRGRRNPPRAQPPADPVASPAGS